MATLSSLKQRIKVIESIEKVTSAMNVVASTKLRTSQRILDDARMWANPLLALPVYPDPKEAVDGDKYTCVVLTSDRGLCGAVNSNTVRKVRAILKQNPTSEKNLILYGGKGKTGLAGGYGKNFGVCFADLQRGRWRSFDQACDVSQTVLDAEFDRATLVYNYSRNVVSYDTTVVPLHTFDELKTAKTVNKQFHLIGQRDVLQCFHEFRSAVSMYLYLCENENSELCSRMNSMGNSAKAAGDMLKAMRMRYNRMRQAKITTELCEIISGAAASESKEEQ